MEPEVTGALLTAAAVLVAAISLPNCWEFRIRITGMMLELLGVSVVALGLRRTRQLFELPTVLGAVRDWLKKFPTLRRDVRIEASAGIFALEGGRAYGLIEIKSRPGGPLDERVTALEMNLNHVLRSVHELEKQFDSTADEHARRLESEKKAREEGDQKAHDRIYRAVASGLHLEGLGVVFLVFGIVFATMSGEIASWFGVGACL
ncbi:MAG: hypothetical protein M5U16_00825 [Hyphomicrobium sp.]|nr:hypothetical protein [Hyphomicrobium sp.]